MTTKTMKKTYKNTKPKTEINRVWFTCKSGWHDCTQLLQHRADLISSSSSTG